MFKTETHLHTSEVSKCGKIPAAEMVKLYKEAGYDTIFVTDHFSKKYLKRMEDLSYTEKVDFYFTGYEAAKSAGDACGLTVLPGAEVSLNTHDEVPIRSDLLLYGSKLKEFLAENETLIKMDYPEFFALAKKYDLIVIQAHPFRDECNFPFPQFVDGFEVLNSNPRHENFTEKAIACAKEHNKPVTAGSDAHRTEDVGGAGVMTAEKITSPEQYIELFLSRKLIPFEGDFTL